MKRISDKKIEASKQKALKLGLGLNDYLKMAAQAQLDADREEVEEAKKQEMERIYQVDKKTLLRNWKKWNQERERLEWAAT